MGPKTPVAQKFVDAVDLVVHNMSEHVFEVGTWVDFVEFARTDETVHRRS